MDSSDDPHISYYDSTNRKLRYAYNPGTWGFADVDTHPSAPFGGGTGTYTSMAIDTDGDVYISYYYWTTNVNRFDTELKYAHCESSCTTPSNWDAYTLDTDGEVGTFTSIDVLSYDTQRPKFISYAGKTPPELAGHSPAVAAGCDTTAGCVYVHHAWVQPEYLGGEFYNRIYYRRSSDNGDSWDIPGKPISELRGESGYLIGYLATRPSIHVVGDVVHVAWIQGHVRHAGFPFVSDPFERVFYQRSANKGVTWLSSDVKVDDSRKVIYVETGTHDTKVLETSNIAFLGWEKDQSPVSIYATSSDVYVSWQSGFLGRDRVYWDKVADSDAATESEWGGDVGSHSSMVMDSYGRVYMSYYDETNTALKFAGSNERGLFETQTVDTIDGGGGGDSVGQFTSIAIDSHPYPHISYYDSTDDDLKYAKWTGEKWEFEIVDDTVVSDSTNVGQYTSIAIDSSGYPHISYYDATNTKLKYAKWGGSSWTITNPDTSTGVGEYASIVLDSSDYAHISYYDATNTKLKYAKWGGGSWSISNPDTSTGVGQHTSITLDSSDYAHISYYDAANHKLKYAKWGGSSWSIENPDTSTRVGQYTSLTLDSSGYPHISYYDVTNGDLKYVKKTVTGWGTPQSPDTTGAVGKYTSIALDLDDHPYITYYDATNKRAKYRGWAGNIYEPDDFFIHTIQNEDILSAPWWDKDRDRWGKAGLPDLTGKDTLLHVVYEDVKRAQGDLKYVYEDGSGWKTGYPPDTTTDIVGQYTSIALDSSGRPHIAYYDVTNYVLKYTYRSSTPNTWVTVTVPDPHEFVGTWASMVLVSNKPHIAYFDYSIPGIRYAYKDGSDWHFCDVPTTMGSGRPGTISMAVDGSPGGAITQFTFLNMAFELVRARYTGTTCQFDLKKPDLPPSTYANAYSSLALKGGLARISYVTLGLKLRYVYETSYNNWVNEPVDFATRFTFSYNSIALDSTANAHPHIAYYDMYRGNLKYAYKSATGWHLTTDVDTAGDVGQHLDIALDKDDNPHISYYDATNGDLKHAKWTGSAWSINTRDTTGDVGKFTSIVIVPLDTKPYISYYDESDGDGIFYRKGFVNYDTDGVWKDEKQVSDLAVARPSSPQVAAGGDYVHVVWHDERGASTTGIEVYYNRGTSNGDTWSSADTQVSDGDVSYPYPDDKFPRIAVSGATVHVTWQKEKAGEYEKTFTVVWDDGVNSGNSLAVGMGNEYRTSFHASPSSSNGVYGYYKGEGDSFPKSLQAGNDLGNWLPSSDYCQKTEDCHYTSIGIDLTDLAHVAFYDGYDDNWDGDDLDLYYIYQYWTTPPNPFKTWATPVKVDGDDNDEDMGQYLSMALETDQTDLSSVDFHISYYNAQPTGNTKEDLMYATGDSTSHTTEIADDGGSGKNDVGKFTSIALDRENRPHISYYDADDGDLRYVYYDGTNWQPTTWNDRRVDITDDVGQYTSIAIDSKGKIHISYYDVTNGNLEYAYGSPGSWTITTVDSTGDVGKFTSIELDIYDQPHISYYDETNDDLKYAFKDSNGWHTFDPIDSAGTVGTWTSMSLGLLEMGCPQISYIDVTNEDLKYVRICPMSDESDIMSDQNKEAGTSGKWGTDQKEVPFPLTSTGLREDVTSPDIAVMGNDIHIPYHIEWQENPVTSMFERGAMGYLNHLDILTEKGDLPDPPESLMGASAVRAIYNGGAQPVEQIYIIGGVISETGPDYSGKVWRYDPNLDTYTSQCTLPRDIAYTSAVYEPTNGVIYVFGGLDEGGAARAEIIEVHPTTLNTCTDHANVLTTARYGTSAVFLDGLDTILIFGGVDTQATPDYKDEILSWTPGLSDATALSGVTLPQDMAFTSAIAYGSGISQAAFVFGGQELSSSYLDKIVKVHKPLGLWASVNLGNVFLPTERSGTSATIDGTYAYIFGGKDSSSRYKDILRFNPRVDVEGAVVKLCYYLPAELQYTAAAYAEDTNKGSYVFGGGTPSPSDYVVKYQASYDPLGFG